MRSSLFVTWLIVCSAVLALPVSAYAQEAVLSGTVTDSTGGVLPGVTVTATNEASGNTFVAITDAGGAFRIAVRTGGYRVTLELSGFSTVNRSGLELLVGQQAVVNLQMAPSTVQESVTVTGEAPLIDTSQSSVGGNIDPRQMQELPVNGRNWQDLVAMAPGSRTNAVADQPTPRERRDYNLNMDGQQVTQNLGLGSAGNPLFSRDAIAEFQYIGSRFDATQGRSSGVQVNAISKSGTNAPAGTFSGYFRNDRFNAADFVSNTVLPYSNQQISATFGGPIRKDRVHVFGNYEYQREPHTFAFTTPWPRFNITLSDTNRQVMGGLRLDFQLSTKNRLMVRANTGDEERPLDSPGAHPSSIATFKRHMDEVFTSLTQVLGNRALNEIKGGFASYYYFNQSAVNWPNHPMANQGITFGTPQITLTGFSIGQSNTNYPQRLGQTYWSLRDDFTYSFNKGGRHDVKLGGEYLLLQAYTSNCRECGSVIDAQGGTFPTNIESLFPVWNDVSTWNLAALTPNTRQYRLTVGTLQTYQTRPVYAAWIQDDWAMTPRLTLNLGLRYDLSIGAWGNDVSLPPFLEPGRPDDKNNLGPRLGFALTLNDRTVIRGGSGVYFGEILNNVSSRTQSWTQLAGVQLQPDGRTDFAANPFNGPTPTYAQAVARYCSNNNVAGCLRTNILQFADPKAQMPVSYQSSIGLQRQIGNTMAFEADYVYNASRHEYFNQNMNLKYDPATGLNLPFSIPANRPYPDYATLGVERMAGKSNYSALQTALTRRMSNRWQASATYTFAGYWDGEAPPLSGLQEVTFKVAPDLGGDYGLAVSDQRHRAVFNGIWQIGYGFQLSGQYFYGSGARFASSWGGDLRGTGGTGGRLRPNNTVVARNDFVGKPLHRVDMRIQRRLRLGGRVGVDGIVEVFNLFNHANYGSYTTAESNSNYGKPTQNTNVAYQPRMMQLGFRATF